MQSLSDHQPPVRPLPADRRKASAWQADLQEAFRDPVALCEHLGLPQVAADLSLSADFPLIAPRPFVARMRYGDISDPLLLQVLPLNSEEGETPLPSDAVGDLAAQRCAGVIQKYQSRVLLIASRHCGINCRYCFRRHYPYEHAPQSDAAWQPAIDEIRRDASLREVILSGGDPLILSDDRLQRIISQLDDIDHLRTLRIHTRLPVVIPKRVTEKLLQTLASSRLQVVVVLHVNHANEIDDTIAAAVEQLRLVALVLNQSVLLRRINDQIDDLMELSERLIEVGVLPYYLHKLDVVRGVKHFEVEQTVGEQLIAELRRRLPGYAVPRFVVEERGADHKTLLA